MVLLVSMIFGTVKNCDWTNAIPYWPGKSASLRAGVGSSYSILNGDFLLGAFLNRWVKAKKGGRLKRKAFLIGVVSR